MDDYQKIPSPHHKEAEGVYDGYIIVEEKVDGSQFRILKKMNGNIEFASHHQELNPTDNNFRKVTDEADEVFSHLIADEAPITIFAEYVSKPKHNKIPYARIPSHFFIVFDVKIGDMYLNRKDKEQFCFKLGLECVPLLWQGNGQDFIDDIKKEILNKSSLLGHQPGYDKIEGIVVKNYNKIYPVEETHSLYGHFMCTKIVNEDFKERKSLKNPNAGNSIDTLKESCKSEARWHKAKQHLEEQGLLKHDLIDIGLLIRECSKDLELEEKESIKEELYKLFRKEIIQHSTNGIAEWYKKELLNNGR